MGLSFTHLLLILVVVLLLFGPTRLPGLGKGFGDAVRGFKKALKEDDTIDVTESSKLGQSAGGVDQDPATTKTTDGDKTRS